MDKKQNKIVDTLHNLYGIKIEDIGPGTVGKLVYLESGKLKDSFIRMSNLTVQVRSKTEEDKVVLTPLHSRGNTYIQMSLKTYGKEWILRSLAVIEKREDENV